VLPCDALVWDRVEGSFTPPPSHFSLLVHFLCPFYVGLEFILCFTSLSFWQVLPL